MPVLTGITLTNWLAHHRANLELTPLTVIAGPNESGKSSVGDGIAFALTGELRRVTAKGERKALLTDGAAKGQVELHAPGGTMIRDIPTGKVLQPAPILPAGLPPGLVDVLLAPASFARMDEDQRRTMLFALSGADLSTETVRKMLLERGHKRAKALPVGGTVEAWHKEAARYVTEARGEWKGITGETYGEKKAEGWTPAAAEAPSLPGGVDDLQEQITLLEAAIAQCNRELGAVSQARASSQQPAADLAALRDRAKQVPAWTSALAEGRNLAAEAAKAVRAAQQAIVALDAGSQPEPMHCPDCGALLMLDPEGRGRHLVAHAAPDPIAAAQARQRAEATLAEATENKRVADDAVTTAEARLERAQSAKRVLDRQEQAQPQEPAEIPEVTERPEDIQARLLDHQRALGQARADLDAAKRHADQVARAAEAKEKAAAAHGRVKDWIAIAAELAPDGIPAEVLGKALKPLNAALTRLAAASGWAAVTIGGDMAITAGGRPYGLHSESGQWRADTMMALALAELAGVRLVVLDRFDVLDLPSRGPALRFLFQTVQAADWTVIVAGTFKAPPQVPPAIRVHWFGPDSMEKAA